MSRPERPRANLESGIKQQQVKWKDIKETLSPAERANSPELAIVFDRLSAEANVLIEKSVMARSLPGGAERIEENFQKLADLYRETVSIRGQIRSRETDVLGMTEGGALSSSFEDQIREKFPKVIADRLINIGNEMSIDTTSIAEGKSQGVYKKFKGGQVGVNAEYAMKLHGELKAIAGNFERGSDQWKLLSVMDTSLGKSIQSDRIATEQVAYAQALEPLMGQGDTRPLRFLVALGGALFTALGIGVAIKRKQMPTWPTYLWAGITLLSVSPDILQSKSMKDLEKAAAIGKPETQQLITQRGISPEVAEEIFALDKGIKRKTIAAIEKNQEKISVAQAADILKLDASSPLAMALTRAKDDRERSVLLRTFFSIDTKGAQEVALATMRNPPVI